MSSRSSGAQHRRGPGPVLAARVFASRSELLPEPPALQGSGALGRMMLVLQTQPGAALGTGRMLQPVQPSSPSPTPPYFCEIKTKSVFSRRVPAFLSFP